MKRNMLLLLCAVITLAATSCHKISGDGPVVSRTINLTGFSGIDAGIDGDVYFTQDTIYKIEIVAQQSMQDVIQTYVQGNVLQVNFEKFKLVGNHSRIAVYVSAPSVYDLGINGSGSLHVLQPVISSDLDLKINGSGNIYVTRLSGTNLNGTINGSGKISVGDGNVKNETLHISGSGDADLLNLRADAVSTHTSGSGTTKVYAIRSLDATISGSGDVYYLGDPSVHTSISGSGKVRPY